MASKWINVESPKMPVAKFAVDVIRQRMQYIIQMLPLAATAYRDDVEHVHQLRVGCRRTGAAVKSFRPLMSSKPAKLQKLLRDVRQAAGPARDADVLLQRLESETDPNSEQTERAWLLKKLKRHRKLVQRKLVAIESKTSAKKMRRTLKKSLDLLLPEDQNKTVLDFAKSALQRASRGLFEPENPGSPTVEHLHQLRIAGKRLRYSIELFTAVFPPALREDVYPIIEGIQDRLGQMNDHATAQILYQRWLAQRPADSHSAYLAARILNEHQASQVIRADFLNWWTPTRSNTLQSQFSELIHCTN